METERPPTSLFSPLVVLRLFAGIFVTLVGLGMMLKAGDDARMFIGAVFAAIGLTFFLLFWLAARPGSN